MLGANVSENHHGSRATGTTLTEIWTLGTLANGVEIVLIHEFAHGLISGAGGQLGAEPLGFS